MKLGRVIGTVVATVKHPHFSHEKVLFVQPIDETGDANGTCIVAVDRAQAGVGDRVLVLEEGTGSRQLFNRKKSPVRSVIVGVVDHVDVA